MKKLVSLILLSFSLSAIATGAKTEPAEQNEKEKVQTIEINAREHNIRVGEELVNFGWRLMDNGNKFCVYQGGHVKHLINADTFEKGKCPKRLIGVKRTTPKNNQSAQ